MRFLKSTWFLVAPLAFLLGCEATFTPNGPYTEKMVVYAILSTQSDTQFVRVYTTYDPSQFHPELNKVDNVIRDAQVSVSQTSSTVAYRDTTVTRVDKTRYQDDIGAYVANPFNIEPGKSYNLSVVTKNNGTATASMDVPDKGTVEVFNRYVLRGGPDEKDPIVVRAWIRFATRGFLVRYFLDVDEYENGQWTSQKLELPTALYQNADGSNVFTYPLLQRRRSDPVDSQTPVIEITTIPFAAYQAGLADIYSNHTSTIKVKGVLFTLTQVERNLYSYYSVANSFQDANTIRLDVPDWSNIRGGYGVFGAMVIDSLYVDFNSY